MTKTLAYDIEELLITDENSFDDSPWTLDNVFFMSILWNQVRIR